MKKQKQNDAKLALKREAIRQLADSHLEQIAGGGCCCTGKCCTHPTRVAPDGN